MQGTTLRVVVASEHPAIRQMLAGMVEREPGGVVVGQAENAVKALALAKRLRPEVALIDSDLPYISGRDSLRLSRISGFDTMMDISRELPRVAAVLIGRHGGTPAIGDDAQSESELLVYGDTGASSMPVKLRDLVIEAAPQGSLVFGGLRLKERALGGTKLLPVLDHIVLYGGLAVVAGLGLMVTLILAGAGAALAG
ncbi:MAG: hypothetical protein Q7R39_16025, partial [Dehalococcoidia bacterium]|nr:hypothetical protein [Dehalococcoidia bacterium]